MNKKPKKKSKVKSYEIKYCNYTIEGTVSTVDFTVTVNKIKFKHPILLELLTDGTLFGDEDEYCIASLARTSVGLEEKYQEWVDNTL